MAQKKHGPSKEKARKMLKEGKVHGKKLTVKQKKFFGLIAGGGKPRKARR